MNKLYKIYFALPNFSRIGVVGKIVNRMLSKTAKIYLDQKVPSFFRQKSKELESGLNSKRRNETYIVSLTSFPARIEEVWITIECLLRQSFKPDAIILWLAEEQFPDRKIPESLTKLKHKGLTIAFCDDLRSHKKYYYTMKNYPDANVITVDDDTYYPNNVLESLVALHHKFPEAICANRVHQITFYKDKTIKNYRKWKINSKEVLTPSSLLVPTGVGGVLYPPNSVAPEVFDKEVFKKVCFYADDLWLKAHSLRNGTKVVTSKKFNKDLIAVGPTQKERLLDSNSFSGGNDEQFQRVCNYYNIELNSFR